MFVLEVCKQTRNVIGNSEQSNELQKVSFSFLLGTNFILATNGHSSFKYRMASSDRFS